MCYENKIQQQFNYHIRLISVEVSQFYLVTEIMNDLRCCITNHFTFSPYVIKDKCFSRHEQDQVQFVENLVLYLEREEEPLDMK